MIFLVAVLSLSLSIVVEKIPKHNTPPTSTYYSSSVYDDLNHQIISIGGVDSYTNTQSPNIWAYSLEFNEFSRIEKLSDYEPTEYAYHASYLRSDRKIIMLGYKSGITSFNLANRAWSHEVTIGDQIPDLELFAYTSFKFNDIDFLAIFGGSSELGLQDTLYL